MLDNPDQVERLLTKVEPMLSIPASVTPGLATALRDKVARDPGRSTLQCRMGQLCRRSGRNHVQTRSRQWHQFWGDGNVNHALGLRHKAADRTGHGRLQEAPDEAASVALSASWIGAGGHRANTHRTSAPADFTCASWRYRILDLCRQSMVGRHGTFR
jgi:hypothetical protein